MEDSPLTADKAPAGRRLLPCTLALVFFLLLAGTESIPVQPAKGEIIVSHAARATSDPGKAARRIFLFAIICSIDHRCRFSPSSAVFSFLQNLFFYLAALLGKRRLCFPSSASCGWSVAISLLVTVLGI